MVRGLCAVDALVVVEVGRGGRGGGARGRMSREDKERWLFSRAATIVTAELDEVNNELFAGSVGGPPAALP